MVVQRVGYDCVTNKQEETLECFPRWGTRGDSSFRDLVLDRKTLEWNVLADLFFQFGLKWQDCYIYIFKRLLETESIWALKRKYTSSFKPRGILQFSHSVVPDSLQPHESQHTRPPCPLPTPRVHSNSCPSSWWCHPAISFSVVPFSSCPQSLPASGSFQWVNSLHEVAKVLEFQLQHQSFQWTARTDHL